MKWIISISLAAALFLFFFVRDRDSSDIAMNYRYAVEDIDAIEKIKIDYRLMEPDIVLEKKSGHWQLNNRYRARQDAMENLLDAIKRIELKFIPRPAGKTTMIKDLATTGTRVRIYGTNDQLIQAYFVGGNTPDERATFIIKDGTQDPAAVSLSGFEGTIGTRFVMPEIDWRDRIIFREDPDEIEELTVDYPAQKEASFTLRKTNGVMLAYPLEDNINTSQHDQKPGAIEAYLQNYKSVGAEAIISDQILKDSLLNKIPFVRITLKRNNQEHYAVQLYPIAISSTGTVRDQLERYYLIDNHGELYLTQHRVFQKLFLDRNFFFTKDSPG